MHSLHDLYLRRAVYCLGRQKSPALLDAAQACLTRAGFGAFAYLGHGASGFVVAGTRSGAVSALRLARDPVTRLDHPLMLQAEAHLGIPVREGDAPALYAEVLPLAARVTTMTDFFAAKMLICEASLDWSDRKLDNLGIVADRLVILDPDGITPQPHKSPRRPVVEDGTIYAHFQSDLGARPWLVYPRLLLLNNPHQPDRLGDKAARLRLFGTVLVPDGRHGIRRPEPYLLVIDPRQEKSGADIARLLDIAPSRLRHAVMPAKAGIHERQAISCWSRGSRPAPG